MLYPAAGSATGHIIFSTREGPAINIANISSVLCLLVGKGKIQ